MITSLVATYGYLAVFVGTLLEGETILVSAGFAAQRGLLSWPVVLEVAIAGATLGDQMAFLLGRWKGPALVRRYPRLAQHQPRIHALLARYDIAFVLLVRFLYGLRIAGPIILGTSPMPLWRFALFNMVGATLWAVVVFGVGHAFGNALEAIWGNIKHLEEGLIVAMLLAGLGLVLWRQYRQHRQAKTARATQRPPTQTP